MNHRAISLLEGLIATPSFSRQEDGTAALIEQFLSDNGASTRRHRNNVWATSTHLDPAKPTLLLNSHHDTVRPSEGYTIDPFTPLWRGDRLYGLGSNDAGASAVSLAETFLRLKDDPGLPVNLVLALTAEEEVTGANGMEAMLRELEANGITPDMGIVGEPTGMRAAVAERGLVVLDCTAHGTAGHAARNEGVNALYRAVDDINSLRRLKFDKVSPVLGDIKVTVTMIEAGTQHNVVPDTCRFTVDVRTTDAYTNEQTVDLIDRAIGSDVKPRSTRLRASVISLDHPLVKSARTIGAETFVSPTMSDMAVMPHFPTLKIGPGDSARSHRPDEYIDRREIEDAIERYTLLIKNLKL